MLVFVYGTLKQGYPNHYLLKSSRFVGKATTTTKYAMLDAGFPVLMNVPKGGDFVEGEVYEVDAATAERLDQLEGKGRMYDRVRKYVKMEDGKSVRLHYYVGLPNFWGRRLDGDRPRLHSPIATGNLNWPEGRPA